MKTILSHLRPAIASTLILMVVLCGLYPLAVWGVGQLFFSSKANGSLVVDASGAVRGSRMIGQNFAGEKYFHPRPSVAGEHGYDGKASGGSNLGPTSEELSTIIGERVSAYRKLNGVSEKEAVPADAVTASSSGLDPHISPRNALLQASRVARSRGISRDEVEGLIQQHTAKPDFGVLGSARVNVLELNLALDSLEY